MARVAWLITIVDTIGKWHRATAPKLAQSGVPLPTAARWAKERRGMSPAGLKRKLREHQN